ncbi:hypothetical protein BH20VER3_BH20VER3_01990 [soil metagenome]
MESPASPSRPPFAAADSALRRGGRWLRLVLEVVVLSVLILVSRCANFPDVFVDGKIYFVDADCYARMTRARLVAQHPGLVVRQHDFENYPTGISPHTTAPFDYLIVLLAFALRPFTAQPLDLAGALVSPLLALAAGWFLWWWSRRLAWPARYLMLLVHALSAMLVHGTSLGRPDQQALLIVTVLVALAAEWRLQEKPRRGWSVASGLSWGLALWVSLYEPLILLAALLFALGLWQRGRWWAGERRIGWWVLLALLLLAAGVERRWPAWPLASPYFANWSATIGELQSIGLTDRVWVFWCSGLLLVSPFLLVLAGRRRSLPWSFVALLAISFALTLWQARWGYFLAVVFVLTIPAQLAIVRPKWLAVAVALLALLPLLQFWDTQLWPNEETTERRTAARVAAVQWRALASSLAGGERAPVLAPWWLSPAIAYWSGQPVVAGSSHESLPGIVDSARFYLSTSPAAAAQVLRQHGVKWVLAGDDEELATNSAALLGVKIPAAALCHRLARSPLQVPSYLKFTERNGPFTLYQVRAFPWNSNSLGGLGR